MSDPLTKHTRATDHRTALRRINTAFADLGADIRYLAGECEASDKASSERLERCAAGLVTIHKSALAAWEQASKER